MHNDLAYVLIDREAIHRRVVELARQIDADYRGRDMMMVGILKGSFIFFADLIREMSLNFPLDFMIVSSYGCGTTSSGNIRFIKGLDKDIAGKHLIIVEDIVDSGRTLSFLKSKLLDQGAETIAVCSLLDKPSRRAVDLTIEYRGFEIPDEFVVGYGLDFAEKYRSLPEIGVLKPEVYTIV